MIRGGAVYILTNMSHSTLYVGVASDLKKRIWEHNNFVHPESFTAKYEGFHRIEEAIGREKQLKCGTRKKKEELINAINPEWRDLYSEILEW